MQQICIYTIYKCVKRHCKDKITAWAMLFQQLSRTATEWQDLKYTHTTHGTLVVTTQFHTAVKSHCMHEWTLTQIIHSSVRQYLKPCAWPAQSGQTTFCCEIVLCPLPHPISDWKSRYYCSSGVTEKGSKVHWIGHKPPLSAYHHWTTRVTGPKAPQIPHEVRH